MTGDYYATAAYGEANRWLAAEVERLTAERDAMQGVTDAARNWRSWMRSAGINIYSGAAGELIKALAALDSGEPAATPAEPCPTCGAYAGHWIGRPCGDALDTAAGSTPAGHEDCGNCLHPYGKHCTCCPDNCRGND